mmetsp:Transcript_48045/g.127329  ORF Transcript_48045/g.127329 Transcript_48045/m.127329 type:complete len:108 (-) Transcript_48045:376-699(-)
MRVSAGLVWICLVAIASAQVHWKSITSSEMDIAASYASDIIDNLNAQSIFASGAIIDNVISAKKSVDQDPVLLIIDLDWIALTALDVGTLVLHDRYPQFWQVKSFPS